MKTFRNVAAIMLAVVALGGWGCDTMKDMFKPTVTPPTAEQQAAETAAVKAHRMVYTTIIEANVGLTALNQAIGDNSQNQAWTKATAQEYLDKSKEAGKAVDRAQKNLDIFNISDAKTQADAVKALILELQKEVAKLALKRS